jgi:pyruvyl transferase EpsO
VPPEALPADPVARLRAILLRTIAPLLAGVRRVALLDFPNYTNPGDSAIWLGALRLLEECGIGAPVYVADLGSYDPRALARRLDDGAILITGGGNFGDLYPAHQAFRERVAREFPALPIIQLPQAVHFVSPAALDRCRAALAGHRAFTLLARDRRSYDLARGALPARTILCPDLAFALGNLRRPGPPSRDVVWQSRRDRERPATAAPGAPAGDPERVDWTRPRRSFASIACRHLPRAVGRWPRALAPLEGPLARVFRRMAGRRLAAACGLLGGGRVVATNRLHGHVLCLLMGIPHFLSDNSYGKVRAFYDTWTAGAGDAVFCASEAEAVLRARALAAAPRPGPGRGTYH